MSLSNRAIKNRSCGGMIAYAGDDRKRFLVYEESSGKNSHEKYMRSVSCGYELISCDYIMSMLWTCYTKGYINEMKEMWYAACWDKHG